MKQLLSVSSAGPMLSKHILSIELSFSLCLHLGLAFCPPGLCGRSTGMAPLSPLPPFQVPLPLPLLLPLSPVPVRDRLPANVLVVLCACRSVGNKLPPTIATVIMMVTQAVGNKLPSSLLPLIALYEAVRTYALQAYPEYGAFCLAPSPLSSLSISAACPAVGAVPGPQAPTRSH
jgi:hypothetical protein